MVAGNTLKRVIPVGVIARTRSHIVESSLPASALHVLHDLRSLVDYFEQPVGPFEPLLGCFHMLDGWQSQIAFISPQHFILAAGEEVRGLDFGEEAVIGVLVTACLHPIL